MGLHKLPPVNISSHLFAYETFSRKHLIKIKEKGFTGLELWGMKPYLNYDHSATVSRLIKGIQEVGINVPTIHAPFYKSIEEVKAGAWLSLGDIDERKRKDAVTETRKIVFLAEKVSAHTIVIHMGGCSDTTSDIAQMSRSIHELIEDAATRNIRLALENINTDFSRTEKIMNFIARFPGEWLGVCLDIGHANLNEHPLTALANTGERLFSLHLSDNFGKIDQHLIPGEGEISWKKVKEKLLETAFPGPLTLELRSADWNYDRTLESAYNNLYRHPGFFKESLQHGTKR
ncbi:MAG: sugar phosphate isomerase/epimerase family protein [bacterium]